MGFWDYMLDSDYRQRHDIEGLKRRARSQARAIGRRARRRSAKVEDLAGRVEDLEEQVGSLTLVTRALLDVLRARSDWSEEAFGGAIHDLDVSDGKLDGKLDGEPFEKPDGTGGGG